MLSVEVLDLQRDAQLAGLYAKAALVALFFEARGLGLVTGERSTFHGRPIDF